MKTMRLGFRWSDWKIEGNRKGNHMPWAKGKQRHKSKKKRRR